MEHLRESHVYLNVGDYVKEHRLYEDYDDERDCYVLNEDALVDHLDERIKQESKSLVLDYHGCDLFLSEWFEAIFVLRTTSDLLYRRLEDRDYPESKISENVQCEIFQIILEEARDAFEDDNIEIIELQNDNDQDQIDNVDKILHWIRSKASTS